MAWDTITPDAMTLEELQSAKDALQAAVSEDQATLAWESAALQRVVAEIASRFNLTIPGTPDPSGLPEYPLALVTDKF